MKMGENWVKMCENWVKMGENLVKMGGFACWKVKKPLKILVSFQTCRQVLGVLFHWDWVKMDGFACWKVENWVKMGENWVKNG